MPANQYAPLEVKVWGDFACFTRPEMKVERVTYPVITPSAARGVLEAIFWKPQFDWRVEEIRVLKPIRYFSILRNEIASRQTERIAQRWQKAGGGFAATADRQQRHTLALRDVAYIIKAKLTSGQALMMIPPNSETSSDAGSPPADVSPPRTWDAGSSPLLFPKPKATNGRRTSPRTWAACCCVWNTIRMDEAAPPRIFSRPNSAAA